MYGNDVSAFQRTQILDITRKRVSKLPIRHLIEQNGTPLQIINKAEIRKQYIQLQQLLPDVKHHFALKSIEHPCAIDAIKSCGGYIEVATQGEIDMVESAEFPLDRCIHTHPVKSLDDIRTAYKHGIRRFVVDTEKELLKFSQMPNDIELLVRLSFNDPNAGINLSYKFGASTDVAESIIKTSLVNQLKIIGFCMHVGSQISNPGAYSDSIKKTVRFIEDMESRYDISFRVLDIGGGFPAPYRKDVPSIKAIANEINSAITPLVGKYEIWSEPGRFVVASSGTSIIRVTCTAERQGERWAYVDDGVYGLYANSVFESAYPHFFHLNELESDNKAPLHPVTIAGPTCDSIDILSKQYPLPRLEDQDILISPMTGAYFSACMTNFNAIPKASIVIVDTDAISLNGSVQI